MFLESIKNRPFFKVNFMLMIIMGILLFVNEIKGEYTYKCGTYLKV